jgi:hypothetical protein
MSIGSGGSHDMVTESWLNAWIVSGPTGAIGLLTTFFGVIGRAVSMTSPFPALLTA